MPRWPKVVIDGVGLIGGSIGRALREQKLAECVIGLGRSPQRLERAIALGAIDQGVSDDMFPTATADLLREIDVAIVCTPVDLIAQRALRLTPRLGPSGWVMDAGSTKGAICRELRDRDASQTFIGAHPLAGAHQAGVEASRADLFLGKSVILTPIAKTPDRIVQQAAEFWEALGAVAHRMSPEEHDRVLAFTSHLPHLAASALAAATPSELLPWTASGWRDATRIAAADPDLWISILEANRSHSLRALDNFAKVLASIRDALEHGDPEALRRWLETGKKNRDSVAN